MLYHCEYLRQQMYSSRSDTKNIDFNLDIPSKVIIVVASYYFQNAYNSG